MKWCNFWHNDFRNIGDTALNYCFLTEQKNYTFSSSSAMQAPPLASATTDNSSDVVQVKLSTQLEEAMLDLIKKESLQMSAAGYVSQRLNARKLTVCMVFISAHSCIHGGSAFLEHAWKSLKLTLASSWMWKVFENDPFLKKYWYKSTDICCWWLLNLGILWSTGCSQKRT